MHRTVILSSIALVYFALAGYALWLTGAGIVATAIVLFAIPATIMAHYSLAPSSIVLAVAAFGLGLGLLLEGIAHMYGLWYTIGLESTRIFGLVPLEVLMLTVSQVIFLALLYELMFDDGQYTPTNLSTRMIALMVFAVSVCGLLFFHQIIFAQLFVEYAYLWVLFFVALSALAMLGVYRVYSVQFFDRILHFTLAGAIPGLIALVLAVTNTHKVFANTSQYTHSLIVFGEVVPLEELLLAFLLPLFVATMYELYLDDQS